MNQSEALYEGLHHVSLLVSDLERSTRFYTEVLGMKEADNRPVMSFPGIWLQAGAQQIHLLALAEGVIMSKAVSPGRDAHCALAVTNISEIQDKLKRQSIPYQLSQSGRNAIFCRDPDGNGLEFIEMQDD